MLCQSLGVVISSFILMIIVVSITRSFIMNFIFLTFGSNAILNVTCCLNPGSIAITVMFYLRIMLCLSYWFIWTMLTNFKLIVVCR